MSTRSMIGILGEDNQITAIYCHWDGYPEWNGKVLSTHYKDATRIGKLIGLGAISNLGEDIGEKHKFEQSSDKIVTAYHRDRGDKWADVKPVKFDTEQDYINDFGSCNDEYRYLYKSGQWFVYAPELNGMQPATQVLASLQASEAQA